MSFERLPPKRVRASARLGSTGYRGTSACVRLRIVAITSRLERYDDDLATPLALELDPSFDEFRQEAAARAPHITDVLVLLIDTIRND